MEGQRNIVLSPPPFCDRVVEPLKATDDDLRVFHSSDYLSFLKAHNGHDWDDLSTEDMEEAETWGLGKYRNRDHYMYNSITFSKYFCHRGFKGILL